MEAGIKSLNAETNEIRKDVKETHNVVDEFKKEFSSTVLKINAMHHTMEKFMTENSQNQTKIDNILRLDIVFHGKFESKKLY